MKCLSSIIACALLSAGDSQGQNILSPGGPMGRSISNLTWFILLLFIGVSVIMWLLCGWILTRPRGTFEEHAPVDAGGGKSWILIGGLAIPSVVLGGIFVMGVDAMNRLPMDHGNVHPAEIRVIAHQWWWEVRYLSEEVDQSFATANEIHIPVGRPIEIELLSRDVIHSFWVPELNGKVDVVPGHTNRIRLEASRPGFFLGECSEFCGVQHAHMAILLVAQAISEYEEWLAGQRSAANLNESTSRGQALFIARPCGLCHTIRGTPAQGTIGPDLTHLASRRGIGANMLIRDSASLAAWSVHAQSLKPGIRMPNITQFNGQELLDLVTYLQSLR